MKEYHTKYKDLIKTYVDEVFMKALQPRVFRSIWQRSTVILIN